MRFAPWTLMEMPDKPQVLVSILDETNYHLTYSGYITLRLNGAVIAEGTFGGEPEDNSRHRDYKWVVEAMAALAEGLGADIEIVETEGSADDEDMWADPDA